MIFVVQFGRRYSTGLDHRRRVSDIAGPIGDGVSFQRPERSEKGRQGYVPTDRSPGGGLLAGRTGEEAVRLKAESTVWDNLVLSPDGSSGNRDAAGIVRVRVGKVI